MTMGHQPHRGTVRGPAGDVAYLDWSGPADRAAVLFLHPVNTAGEVWTDVAKGLAGERRAVAPDYRGHGGSAGGDGPYLPADFAADALAVADALGLERVHLVGGSIGGAVAVEFLARAPARVASIAVFGATLRIGLTTEELRPLLAGITELGVEAWFRKHGGDILGPRSRPEVAERLAELAGGRDLSMVLDIVRSTFQDADSRATAAGLPASRPPALVAVGTHDPTCPPAMAQELAGHLGVTAVTMDGIGHLPMLEAPDEVVTRLNELHQHAD